MNSRRNPFDEMERMFEQMRRSMMQPSRSSGLDRTLDDDRTDDGFRMDVDSGMDLDLGRGAMGDRGTMDRGSRFGRDANLTVETTDDAYVVLADLPGFETEEIDLRFDEGRLTIVAESDVDEEHEGFRSRRSRSVRESVRVGRDVIAEEIGATYRNGVLEIRLPLSADVEGGHRIDID